MKTIKTLFLFLLCSWGISANAQVLCGITQTYFYSANNPNNVPVFHDTSTYAQGWAPVSYFWDFGDGTTSNLASPSHVFGPGNFTVCMTVTAQLQGSSITCTDTFCKPYSNCSGMVVATYSYGQAGNGVVNFTGTGSSNYPPLAYAWDFGDGSTGTGTSPSHTYTSNGTYTACLYVTDANGCVGTYCQNIVITSTACGSLNASFTIANPTQSAVVLTSVTSGANTNTLYQWWMDGVALTNPNPNTSYTITGVTTGQHTFCLYVYANANTFCDSVCATTYVQNGANPCGNVNASFTATSGNGSLTVNSTSTSVPSGASYQWYLNGVATALAPTYLSYSWNNLPAGSYNVCLYIWSSNQQWCDSSCQTVVVQNTNPCAGINTQFSNSIQGNVGVFTAGNNTASVNHYWTVNHDPVGTAPILTYTFPVNPNTVVYDVCHIVYLSNGTCYDSTCTQITIAGSGGCSLQAYYTYTNQGSVYTFTGTYANTNYQQIWAINGNPAATTGSFTYTFPVATTSADVCYTVSIPGTICRDTFCQTITIGGGNCLNFGVSIAENINPNGGFNLDAIIAGGTGPYNYAWSIGATTPTVHVTTGGMYCVTVYDHNQCSAVACDSAGGSNNCNIQVSITGQGSGFFQVLTASATGGTAPYTYHWNGSNSNILTVNAPGTYCITVYDALQCMTVACYTVAGGANDDTICGQVFEDINGNGVQDNGESGFAGGYIYIGNYFAYVDSDGHYSAIVPDGTYTIYYCAPTGYSFTLPVNQTNPNPNNGNCTSYTVTITQGTLCGFDFGVVNNNISICGTVYFDANNNHIHDSGENGIGNIHVYISGGGAMYHAYTDQNGDYCVVVPAGTYVITLGSNTLGGTVTPTSVTVNATTVGGTYYHNDFGIYTPPGSCNLSLSITPHTTITPGFPAWYDIEVCNIGGNITSGTVNMFYDNSLTFSNANPTQTSHNASTHTISWALNNLLPGQCEYYWVDFDANTNITIGQFAFTLANVITSGCQDINMANNVDTIHQNVTGSWDPNNKLAYVTNYEENPAFQTVSSQNAYQRIEYVINFQNTGNAPAVNVVVKDLISSDLDISTFELLGASHAMTATLNGSDVNFKFNAIMLPDMVSDEPNSHGWVKFAVDAVNGLPGGHVISDVADIFFDYNQPVTTNDAAVTLLEANGIEETGTNTTVLVSPNPMNSQAIFKLNSAANGFTLRVHDMSGRLVRQEMSNSNTLTFDRTNLASGVYTYQIVQSNIPSAKGKMIIE